MTPMDDRYEALLRQGLIAPPADFTTRTMARVAAEPFPRVRQRRRIVREVLQWVALAGAGLVGATHVLGYMFGIWILSSAG